MQPVCNFGFGVTFAKYLKLKRINYLENTLLQTKLPLDVAIPVSKLQ